jgi:signal transduction histidine kinase/ActR/RegA family two-component response regulator
MQRTTGGVREAPLAVDGIAIRTRAGIRRAWVYAAGRYALAVVAIAAAALFRGALDPILGDTSPFLPFTPVVMLVAWYGGLGPGLLATLLGALIGAYFWIDPLYTFLIVQPHEAVHVGLFVCIGAMISAMSRTLKGAQLRAEAASRAKDEFLARVSHELRNPLNPIVSVLDVIEEDAGAGTGKLRQDVEIIRQSVAVQMRLIDDLLDLQRVVYGKLELRRRTCDLHAVVRQAADVCARDVHAKRQDLHLDLRAERHYVDADPTRLVQVFWNLLRNASKFTPPGGRIGVRTTDRAHDVRVEVRDTGIGMTPKTLRRLFRPFQQGSRAVTRRYGGLGLGLSIAKELTELHGGHISAHSDGTGRGSTFSVTLPVVAAPGPDTAEPPEPAPAAGRAGRLRILIAEDDARSAETMARLLTRDGHDVSVAHGVTAAVELAAGRSIDLLVSDLDLPDGGGDELLRQLRAKRDVVGICVTGHSGADERQRVLAAGFFTLLVKPVDVQALRRAIGEAAGRAPARSK